MRNSAAYQHKCFLNAHRAATEHRYRQQDALRQQLPWRTVESAPQREFVHTLAQQDGRTSAVLTLMRKGRFWFDEQGNACADTPTHWAPITDASRTLA